MTNTNTSSDSTAKKVGRRLIRWSVILVVVAAVIFGAPFLMLVRGVQAPVWAKEQIQTLINQSLPNAQVQFADMDLILLKGSLDPNLTVSGIEIFDQDGALQLVLPAIQTQISRQELIRGRIRPVSVRLQNAELQLIRRSDGKFNISFGDAPVNSDSSSSGGFADVLSSIENIFDQPTLSYLQVIESQNTSIAVLDKQSGRSWQLSDGRIIVTNQDEEIGGTIGFTFKKSDGEDTTATVSLKQPGDGEAAEISANFDSLNLSDVTDQMPSLGEMGRLTSPLSGSVTIKIGSDGVLGDVSGVLDVGAGQFTVDGSLPAVTLKQAKIYYNYDAKRGKVTIDDLAVDADLVQIKGQGQVLISDQIYGTNGAAIGQMQFNSVVLNPPGIFSKPVNFDVGALDARVQFNPLKIDIGQLVLDQSGSKFVASGSFSTGPDGWTNALDITLNGIKTDDLLQLWPLTYKGQTRKWFSENIHGGQLSNVIAVLRMAPGEGPNINVGFDLADMTVRYMKALPVLQNGRGYGVLTEKDLLIAVDEGFVSIPEGGDIDLAGSSMFIPEIRMKAAPAEISLQTDSSIRAAMGLLDLHPFSFMSKAGVALDIAQGRAKAAGTINLPLAKKVTFDQVVFSLGGDLIDVSSTSIVKGKTLRASILRLRADNDGVSISGSGILGETPVRGAWRQKLGPAGRGKSEVDGTIELSQRFLDEFNIALPKGSVTGAGIGNMSIKLAKDSAPEFVLTSDLNRLGLELGAVGWRKPKNVTGRLKVTGQMTSPLTISALSLSTKGLDVAGLVKLKSDGSLDVARFTSVKLDGWLDAPIDIRPNGKNSIKIFVLGGRADFRKSKFADAKSSTQSNSVAISLDRLVLSSGITLTNFTGDLTSGQGTSGSFAANVNGGARIVGALAPQANGVAVRFTSDDAGAVLRSAGVFETAVGGRMDMVLLPATKRGTYNGTLKITKTRVRNASALAEILAGISVIGLIEQLGAEGIAFSDVDAKFVMNPKTIDLTNASAIGASMGITMAGLYDFSSARMDMQGVITPIYALNGILEQSKLFGGLFGAKKGEGLFAFNYTMRGDVKSPKVSVNPLSILTPGILRDLFKPPVPASE